MAEISKKDLEFLSSKEIKEYYRKENVDDLPSPIKEYVEKGRDSFTMGPRLNRVEKLLNIIIVERFLNDKL